MRKFIICILIINSLLAGRAFAQNQQILYKNVTVVLNNPTGLRAKAKFLHSQVKNILKDADNLTKHFDLKERFGYSENKNYLRFLDLMIKSAWLEKEAYVLNNRAAELEKTNRPF